MNRGILRFIFYLGMANFAAFVVLAVYLGGDAISGKIVGSHYFLGNRGHLTEVSHAAFSYSQWHERSVFVTFPIAMLCQWLLRRRTNN